MRALGIAAVVALALVAGPVASAGGKKACTVVTAADASKALHAKVGAGKQSTTGAFDRCTYKSGRKSVVVAVRPIGKKTFDAKLHAITGTVLQATNVSRNAWVTFDSNGIELMIWHNGTEVDIHVLGEGDNASTVALALAIPAVKRF
jgi:hypothetical protein